MLPHKIPVHLKSGAGLRLYVSPRQSTGNRGGNWRTDGRTVVIYQLGAYRDDRLQKGFSDLPGHLVYFILLLRQLLF